ncbi:MAG: xylulokinase [Clostridia bacterium]|nr:xylulokinase [Clostridia bacterium]
MRTEFYLLGIDIGTSGAKCLIMDTKGQVIASALRDYPLYTPKPGWAEQHPEDWWQAVVLATRDLLAKVPEVKAQIGGVCFSGQMHGLVALNKAGEVIRPAILWCDQRTQKQCDEITRLAGGQDGLLGYTNNCMLTGYTGGKLLWLREEEPENFQKMTAFFCPKDYIRYKLTGQVRTDVSEASGIGFFDTKQRVWSEPLISLAGLNPDLFPEALESPEIAGRVTKEAAQVTGLPEGIPCYAGGGDAVIQAVGSGLIEAGTIGIVIGTAGNVSMSFDHFEPNPGGKLQMFCGNEPGLWTSFGATQTAGGAYRWMRDELCKDLVIRARETGENVYTLMNREVEEAGVGAHGIVFAPYLSGERCPYPDPHARGCFYGMSLSTNRQDMLRAVMEGITFSLRQIADIYREMMPLNGAVSSGGGAASEVWLQMQADIMNLPVRTVSAASEGGAYGAALVGMVGAGVFKNLREAVVLIKTQTEHVPDEGRKRVYEKNYQLYSKIYTQMKPLYDLGAEFGY